MKPQKIGDYTVRKLVEVVEPLSPEFAFVEFDPSVLDSHAVWLSPNFVERANAETTLLFSFHTYVVQGNGRTLLIDTCVGNHKERAALPSWHMQNRPYLDNLRSMGVAPEDVNYVMCTHLHADHVGWNTRLIDGRWVPTFPNARYIFSKIDYDHHNSVSVADAKRADDDPNPGEGDFYASMADSVSPIVEAGLADIVNVDFSIDDAISLVSPNGKLTSVWTQFNQQKPAKRSSMNMPVGAQLFLRRTSLGQRQAELLTIAVNPSSPLFQEHKHRLRTNLYSTVHAFAFTGLASGRV
jgi:hypothetical protein